jgi:hypothetical protein
MISKLGEALMNYGHGCILILDVLFRVKKYMKKRTSYILWVDHHVVIMLSS